MSVYAQEQIKGRVTNDLGKPLPNISVVIQGTQNGITTGPEGSFTLNIIKNTVTLEISGVEFAIRQFLKEKKQYLNDQLKILDLQRA